MSGRARNRALGKAASAVPGLRRLPVLKLLSVGEIALVLLRDHVGKLAPSERRRVLELLRKSRGRSQNLSTRERKELSRLIEKAEPRLFVGTAADKLSPIPLPKRLFEGARGR